MNSDLKPKHRLIVDQVSKGIPLKQALINAGYSSNQKSLESNITQLNKNEIFLREIRRAKEKRIEEKILASQLDRDRLATEFYQYYQELRDSGDPSNAIKALNHCKELMIEKQGMTKQIEHKHKISFENLLVDMRKEKENKPMISIN
jgi:phage terminase small subunit|tara:strand:- start:74 stop:514 length:441 start_codon:yes stop_codon:yes gene_type:complete